MNSKERIITALSGRQPDRVPLYIHGINEGPIIGIARDLTEGMPELKQFTEMTEMDKFKLLEGLFLIHEHHGVDGFTAFEIGNLERLSPELVKDEFGVVYQLSELGLPVPKEHPLPEPADLARYTPPEPNAAHLMMLQLAKAQFGDKKALFWLMRGIFVRSWRLMGMENLMFKMFDQPDFVHGVARMVLDYSLCQLDLLAQAGLDVLVVEDDIADSHNTLIAPEQFREFVNPYNRKLVDAAHAKGLKVVRHSDGNLWPIMDTLLDSGYDGLNPLEPQAGMTLERVKKSCGDRICLLGNIDCVELLPHGTPQEVETAVVQAIADAAPGGGYILCSSNSLHPGVDPANCVAMFQAVHRHGVYQQAPQPVISEPER